MARRNRFFGRWLRHGEGYPDWTMRLFDRRHARWSDDAVHEHVLADGPVGRLDGDLLHASAESLDAYLAKQNRYTTLQAEAMHARGEHFSMVRLIGSPLVRFVRFYVLRAGFLDGAAGLVHIAIGCFTSFCKYAKLRALERPAELPMTTLVTGAAGFIGMHLALRLRARRRRRRRRRQLRPLLRRRAEARAGARSWRAPACVASSSTWPITRRRRRCFATGASRTSRIWPRSRACAIRCINPAAYIRNNIDAFGAVIEACRHTGVEHLVYASSSSVYGANHTLPFSEDQNVDHPVSLYAATKKADELIAHSYSHLYRLPTTGLRFFTVYGPWGRPDMAAALFTRAILDGTPIKVFNYGRMRRDFTYIDDIVEGVVRVLRAAARGEPRPAPRRTRSTTSATIRRSIWNRSSASSNACSAGARSGNICRRSRATCRRRSPRSTARGGDRIRADDAARGGIARFVAWYLDYYRADGPARAT